MVRRVQDHLEHHVAQRGLVETAFGVAVHDGARRGIVVETVEEGLAIFVGFGEAVADGAREAGLTF